jgi:hypothetical protein
MVDVIIVGAEPAGGTEFAAGLAGLLGGAAGKERLLTAVYGNQQLSTGKYAGD